MNTGVHRTRGALVCGAVVAGLLLSGCTSTAEPQSSASPTVASSPAGSSSSAAFPTSVPPASPSLNPDYALTINVTIAKGKTIPSGEKINVRVGQKVILNVTRDASADSATAGSGRRSSRKRPSSSPVRCCASAALPPLPQARSLC